MEDQREQSSSDNQQREANIEIQQDEARSPLMTDENGLTDKQEQFCLYYVQLWCKTDAAKRAGYSAKSAHCIGADLYKLPKIRARIKEILIGKRAEYDLTDQRLHLEVGRLAFFDPTEIFEDLSGRTMLMKDLKLMHPRHRAAIKSLKMGKYGLEIQFHDKTQAMDMLAKHLGYYEIDNSQKVASGVAIMLPPNGRGDDQDIPKVNADGK